MADKTGCMDAGWLPVDGLRPLDKGKPRNSADRSEALFAPPGPRPLSSCKTAASVYERVGKSSSSGTRVLLPESQPHQPQAA